MYRGQLGQWAWLLNRASGVAVVFFLYIHILDTALVGFGPQVYNFVTSIYHRPALRILEVLLVGAVLFHGSNGMRLMLIDFWPPAIRYNRMMITYGLVAFVGIMLGVAYVMMRRIIVG
jgi:succinate dehydrogenase / fumarate reductase cytochrome b subunit